MKKPTAIILLLSLSLPLYSQSVSELISDLEEVSRIISDSESSNRILYEQLNLLQQNETLKGMQLDTLEASIGRQQQLYQELSAQLMHREQALQERTKFCERLSLRFKVLSYCTVGVAAAGITGWILWAAGK